MAKIIKEIQFAGIISPAISIEMKIIPFTTGRIHLKTSLAGLVKTFDFHVNTLFYVVDKKAFIRIRLIKKQKRLPVMEKRRIFAVA